MDYYKLAIFGEVGSGKSTIIRTLSEINPINTDVESTVDIGKKYTTVGIDYGRISIDEQTALGLYGVPGQRRYEFLWDVVVKSLWGVVILFKYGTELDRTSIESLLHYFYPNKTNAACIIGITHCEGISNEEVATVSKQLMAILRENQIQAPVLRVNPTDKESAMTCLTLINSINLANA